MRTIATCILLTVLGINNISANNGEHKLNSVPRVKNELKIVDTFYSIKSIIKPSKSIKAKHIQQLNTITNNATKPYKGKVQVLQNSLNQDINLGFEFRKKYDGELPFVTELYATDFGVKFDDVHIDSHIRMFNRNNKFDPIFSAEDVKVMADFYVTKNDLGAKDDEDITSILISRLGAYALVVEDAQILFSFQNDVRTGVIFENNKYKNIGDIYIKSYQEEVIKNAQNKCNGNCSDASYDKLLEDYFVEWLLSWETGLGIYKGTPNADGTYQWQKMEGSFIKLGLAVQN